MSSPEPAKDIAELFRDGRLIDEPLQKAVRQALRMHKLMGNPVAEWRDGKVVWIPPEEIKLDE